MAASDSTRCHAVDQLPVFAGASSGERDAPAPAGDATRAEPGMACEAELQCTRRKGKLILPLQAVGSAPQLHSVAAADGSFDLWLGEFSVSPAGVRAQRQQEHSGNESVPSGGAAAADRADVHLRIMSEGAERYCDLSQYTADGDWQGWKVLHTFTLPGWGSGKVKGREAAQQARLAESTLSSLHKLVKQQVVDLKVASDEDLDSFTRAVRVSVLLKAAVITHGAVPAADLESFHTGRKYSSDLRKVMGCFQPSFVDSESEAAPAGGGEASCGSFDLQELYSAMKHPLTDEPAEPHEALLPTLRPYQLRAVRWMQSREDDAGCRAPARHPLLRELPCSCGKLLYYCEWTGHVATEPTSFSDTVRGGVLCDEMGLGKTVELLHLVLSRPHSLSAHTSVAVLDGVPGSGEGAAESGTESCTPMEPSASTGPCAELAAEPGLGAKEVKAANPFDWMSIDESDSDFGGVQSRDASLASAEEGLPLKRLANDLGTGSVGSPVDRKRSRVGEVERVSSEKREADKTMLESCHQAADGADWLNVGCGVEVYIDAGGGERGSHGPPAHNHEDWYQACIKALRIVAPELGDTEDTPKPRTRTELLIHYLAEDEGGALVYGDAEMDVWVAVTAQPTGGIPVLVTPAASPLTLAPTEGSIWIQPAQGWTWPPPQGGKTAMGVDNMRSRAQGNSEGREPAAQVNPQGLYGACAGRYWKIGATGPAGWEVVDEQRPVKTTLIVCPVHILDQWSSEIARHTRAGSVKVLCYHGMRDSQRVLSVEEIARADIVLTSYDALRGDVHHDGTPGRLLRGLKKYKVEVSPLLRVKWWRVCLDEAQMVESATAKAAEMALKLATHNRWCVTGTPVHRGLEDLWGLALFLGCGPWCERVVWTRALLRPYLQGSGAAIQRTHAWVAQLFWRTQKEDVIHEISLPPQTEATEMVQFTPVESHFYRRQHDECAESVRRVLADLRRRKCSTLDDRTSIKMLQQVLKLRQACCHPQVGGAGVRSVQKKVLTMEEILAQLLERARLECEDAMRGVVSSECGLAGVSILQQEDKAVAMRHYKNVLELEQKGQVDGIRVDPFLKLHVRHNLAQVMRDAGQAEMHVNGRDILVTQLEEEERMCRNEYSATQNANVSACKDRLQAAEAEVDRTQAVRERRWWFLEALDSLEATGHAETVLERVEKALSESDQYSQTTKKNRAQESISGKFKQITGLKFLLNARMKELWDKRDLLLAKFRGLSAEPTTAEIDECGNCSDCKANFLKTGPRCRSCYLADDLNAYKCVVFHYSADRGNKMSREYQERTSAGADGVLKQRDDSTAKMQQERRNKSELETVLIVILRLLRQLGKDENEGSSASACTDRLRVLDVGQQQSETWEKLAVEYDCAQVLWRMHRERLERLDELSMATMRMRYGAEDEDINEHNQMLILQQGLEDEKRKLLEWDRADAMDRLGKSRGQLKYLTNLVRAQTAAAQRKRDAAAAAAESRRLGTGASEGSNGQVATGCVHEGGGLEKDAGQDEGEVEEELGTCPVCTEDVGKTTEVVMLPCGHMLCYQCCRDLLRRSGERSIRCPSCRNSCNHRELTYVYGDRFGEDRAKEGDDGGKEGVSKELEQDQDVKGSYSTKIVSLVRGLKRLPDGEKAIVFSEWEDMLKLLSHALDANDIPHQRCKGSKSVSKGVARFKRDPDIRAMLLPFKSGSNGLNVIEATHVFLIEPLLNVAVEAQAIGRVHRIGQSKPTVVHRMIVEQTVEERVRKLSEQKLSALKHSGSMSLEHARAASQNKETVTLDDMEAMFPSLCEASDSQNVQNEAWWSEIVCWGHDGEDNGEDGCGSHHRGGADRGRMIPRKHALALLNLEQNAVAARRQRLQVSNVPAGGDAAGTRQDGEEMVQLHGQAVAADVAVRLCGLPPAGKKMEANSVDGEGQSEHSDEDEEDGNVEDLCSESP